MKKLPSPLTGDHGLVTWLNTLRQCLLERTPLQSSDTPVDYLPTGFRLKPRIPPGAEGGGEAEQFKIISDRQDYLVCQRATLDAVGQVATLEDEQVRIAKPFELRARPWDYTYRTNAGLTGEITFNSGSTAPDSDPSPAAYRFDYSANGAVAYAAGNPWNRRTVKLVDAQDRYGTPEVQWDEIVWPPYLGDHTPIIYAMKVKQKPIFTVTERTITGPDPDDFEDTPYDIDWVEVGSNRRFVPTQSKIRVCVENADGTTTQKWVAMRMSTPWS